MKPYYEHAGIELYQGKCEEVMAHIPDGSIDAIICDLPYGTTACKWDTIIPFDVLWAHYKRVIKKNGAIVLFGSQPFTSALIMSNPAMFRYEWIWDKSKATGFLDSQQKPLKAHENILVFGKEAPKYYPQFEKGEPYNKGMRKPQTKNDVYGSFNRAIIASSEGRRFPRSIQRFTTAEHEGGFHKSQKPVALLEYLVKTYTNEGERVLDNTIGSGTTGVACVRLGRKFIGIEQGEDYCEIAQNRIAHELSQPQLFAAEPEPQPAPEPITLFDNAA